MTDSAGGRHLDLDVLAELDEGIAGPEVAQAAQAHLGGCAECKDRMAQLRTTRALLSALPADAMPEAVQARISDALEHASTQASATVVPIKRRARVWNSPAIAGAAAVAAVVVLIGALVAGNVIHHGDKSSSSTASAPAGAVNGPKAAEGAVTKEWATGANYTAATIPSLVPRLVTGTPPATPDFKGAAPDSAASVPGAGTVSGQVRGPTPAPATPGVYTQAQLRSSLAAVAACGTILAGGVPTVPVAVDFATYEGKPAAIFVLPAVGNTAQLDVWVVRSECTTSSSDFYFRRIPKPTG